MSTVAGRQPLMDALAAAEEPRIRHGLQLVADHVVAEVAGDLAGVLATSVAEPVYTIWGASGSQGPVGAAAVRQFYVDLICSGKNRLAYVLSRVVADPTAVVTAGEFHQVFDGASLSARLPEVQPGRWYHVAYHALVVWPIAAEGLLAGEEIYAGEPPRVIREITPDELAHLGPACRGGDVHVG